ncbi:hypothetical protein DENSPDRAFT_750668, partial [Dentipellis sp. KUC8613]
RPQSFQVFDHLDYMTQRFRCPYVIFYPILSCDGLNFDINRTIAEIKGSRYVEDKAWRGDIVVVKYTDHTLDTLDNISISDYAILRNYFRTHDPP